METTCHDECDGHPLQLVLFVKQMCLSIHICPFVLFRYLLSLGVESRKERIRHQTSIHNRHSKQEADKCF